MRPHAVWKSWPTPEPGTDLWDFHDGRCGWCGGSVGRIVRDHCHQTGFVRGLLCDGCNQQEADVWNKKWDEWRAGDHTAAAVRHVEVYISTTGATPLDSDAALIYYTRDEQKAWWAERSRTLEAGGPWPTSAPWTPGALAAREGEQLELREALERAGRLVFSEICTDSTNPAPAP